MLINNAVITGSFIVNGVDVTGITGSSNVSSSYLALSASFLVTSASYASASGSLSTRVTNLEATSSTVSSSFATTSGSLSTRVTNLESTSSVVSSSFATTSGSIAGRVTLIEGQYATTGSNNFTKPQQISDVSNAISFTSTASLYTDGGLRVKGSSFISGTAYFNDVVVYGTSSIEYITSSQLAIGTNIITLNTDTPSIRFGGISVFDSGSNNLSTGSLFWDSEKDKWIYSNPSASTYDGGMLISGPRNTSGLGNEVGTTSCALMMGQGGDHITSSAIFSYSNATCFYGQSFISSSGNACFAGQICATNATFNGCVNIFTGNQIRLYNSAKNNWTQIESPLVSGDAAVDLRITTQTGIVYINQTGVTCFNNAICAPRAELTSDASCVPLRLINGVITGGSTTGVTALYLGDAGSGVSMLQREKYAANQANLVLYSEYGYNTQSINACMGYNGVALYTAGTKRLNIDGTGITCFGNTICAKSLWFSSNTTGQITFGSNDACNAYVVSDGNNSLYIGNNNSYKILVPNDGTDMIFRTAATYGNPQTRLIITAAGIACFGSTVCTPTITVSTLVNSPVYYVGGYNSLSRTPSGEMGVLGSNAIACQTASNTIVQMNNSYYASFIRQYYNEGISFYTRANAGTAGDVLYGAGAVTDGATRLNINNTGIASFACQICTPVLRASRVISNSTQLFDSDFSLNAGVTRSVVLCGGIYTMGDFHLMVYGNAGTGMSTIRLSTAGYFANSNLLQFCELQRYTFGSMTISGVSNNGTSISFNIGNCSGSNNGTGFWRMISLNGDAENNCIRVFVL